MSGTGSSRVVLPARRVVVGSTVAALASGALLGLVIGVLSPSSADTTLSAKQAGATGAPTSAAPETTAAASTSSSPSTSSPTTTRTVKTVVKTSQGAPADFVAHPERDRSMSLVILDSVQQTDQGLTLSVRRARVLTGEQARRYWRNQGQQPRDLAVVAFDNAPSTQLPVQDGAAFWGQYLWGDGQNQNVQRLSRDDFTGGAYRILGQGQHPAIWVKRAFAVAGPAVYVAEQFPS